MYISCMMHKAHDWVLLGNTYAWNRTCHAVHLLLVLEGSVVFSKLFTILQQIHIYKSSQWYQAELKPLIHLTGESRTPYQDYHISWSTNRKDIYSLWNTPDLGKKLFTLHNCTAKSNLCQSIFFNRINCHWNSGKATCIILYSYNKNQWQALISQIYFGIELYMFRTGLLSIIGSLVLYTQQ
jgi:hypothetical protein